LIIREPLSLYLAILKGFRSGQHIDFGPYSRKPSSKIGGFSIGGNSPGGISLRKLGKWVPLVDTCFQKGIIEEGIWVKLESRLEGYPPWPKVAPTNAAPSVILEGSNYYMKVSVNVMPRFLSALVRKIEEGFFALFGQKE
jgi:hypothetical protein